MVQLRKLNGFAPQLRPAFQSAAAFTVRVNFRTEKPSAARQTFSQPAVSTNGAVQDIQKIGRVHSSCLAQQHSLILSKLAHRRLWPFIRRLHSGPAATFNWLNQSSSSLKQAAQHLYDMRTQIYCDSSPGSLLAVVQMSNLFQDCKHFVDMPLKQGAATTLAEWRELVTQHNGAVPTEVLATFVNDHFDQPGGELEDHIPEDFNADHPFESISDPHYRQFARDLHNRWPNLSRRVAEKVHQNPENYSIIALPHSFIIPGGRFRELYYWDSFFTIRGLLASKMFGTVKGMIENMAYLVDTYGFIPNGNRIYYLNRSQPPLLTWCVEAYYNSTNDLEFVRKIMPSLEKEMEFFTKNKLITQVGWKSHLFQFKVVATAPRPESYREDYESAEHIEDLVGKQKLWGDIAAAAESGRDFSCRWFSDEGAHAGKMGSTRTSAIIPVELNSIICSNLRIFSNFYEMLGQPEKAATTKLQYQVMKEAIHQVFWNEARGCWFDFDVTKNAQIEAFFDTNLFPLFCGCTHENFDGNRVVDYLTNNGILNYQGIPTSLRVTGQQWDFPSGWAPMNWIAICGLKAIGQVELAKTLASKWISHNYNIFKGIIKEQRQLTILDKNISIRRGTGTYIPQDERRFFTSDLLRSSRFRVGWARGGGGEYELQEGFGWTNGVILDLLQTFATELSYDAQSLERLKCECCRPQHVPTQNVTVTPPQDSIISQLSLPVDVAVDLQQPTQEQLFVAALAAELAQNTPTAAINEVPALIRAA